MGQISKILIFDTNIFLLGIDFNLIKGTIFTTPGVIKEISVEKYTEKNRTILQRIQVAIDRKKLIVKKPLKKYYDEIERKSLLTGDFNALSKTDKQVITLALELKEETKENIVVYTNDYSMENLCLQLKLEFSPVGKKGITGGIVWEIFCPFCKKLYDPTQLDRLCDRCGQKLIRRKKN
ncbi:MAG: hypothetical protein JW891_06865 [Candidatus Lokiarchaeota archaeon]|nr:hypothetical protein [Candidatus Lokiarchaeota archaeon]